jgi:hypothetical protein
LAWGCGLDLTGSGQGLVAGCCECDDEPSGSCATELVSNKLTINLTGPLLGQMWPMGYQLDHASLSQHT